jgi:hypothetical protein
MVEQTRQWRIDRATGPWAITYKTNGTGVRFSRSELGWALSGAICGHGALVGWIRSREARSIQVGLQGRTIVIELK